MAKADGLQHLPRHVLLLSTIPVLHCTLPQCLSAYLLSARFAALYNSSVALHTSTVSVCLPTVCMRAPMLLSTCTAHDTSTASFQTQVKQECPSAAQPTLHFSSKKAALLRRSGRPSKIWADLNRMRPVSPTEIPSSVAEQSTLPLLTHPAQSGASDLNTVCPMSPTHKFHQMWLS